MALNLNYLMDDGPFGEGLSEDQQKAARRLAESIDFPRVGGDANLAFRFYREAVEAFLRGFPVMRLYEGDTPEDSHFQDAGPEDFKELSLSEAVHSLYVLIPSPVHQAVAALQQGLMEKPVRALSAEESGRAQGQKREVAVPLSALFSASTLFLAAAFIVDRALSRNADPELQFFALGVLDTPPGRKEDPVSVAFRILHKLSEHYVTRSLLHTISQYGMVDANGYAMNALEDLLTDAPPVSSCPSHAPYLGPERHESRYSDSLGGMVQPSFVFKGEPLAGGSLQRTFGGASCVVTLAEWGGGTVLSEGVEQRLTPFTATFVSEDAAPSSKGTSSAFFAPVIGSLEGVICTADEPVAMADFLDGIEDYDDDRLRGALDYQCQHGIEGGMATKPPRMMVITRMEHRVPSQEFLSGLLAWLADSAFDDSMDLFLVPADSARHLPLAVEAAWPEMQEDHLAPLDNRQGAAFEADQQASAKVIPIPIPAPLTAEEYRFLRNGGGTKQLLDGGILRHPRLAPHLFNLPTR